jgi:hypothetical protein
MKKKKNAEANGAVGGGRGQEGQRQIVRRLDHGALTFIVA